MNDDEPTDNLEAARMLEGRSVTSIDLSERWSSLTLKLDDGSVMYVDALKTAELEIAYLSPTEVFEIDRTVMEEEIADQVIERLRSEGHLPALFDDRLVWIELPHAAEGDLGAAWLTHETRIDLAGGTLRAYRVSDGSRHVDRRDLDAVFGAVATDEAIGKEITNALTLRERADAEAGE